VNKWVVEVEVEVERDGIEGFRNGINKSDFSENI
jgi:hypothetical protein